MNENNPIRRLRLKLGLSQPDLGRLIGKSHGSVANYEKGFAQPAANIIERLKSIAVEHAFADLAVELSSADWQVRTLIHPPQDFARRQASITDTVKSGPAGEANRQIRHALLDALLDSGNEDAIMAVEHLLRYFNDSIAVTAPLTTKPKATGQRNLKAR